MEVKKNWFPAGSVYPQKPDVYLTRSSYNHNFEWWRAFDGNRWHCGYPAKNPHTKIEYPKPDYETATKAENFLAPHISHEWYGADDEMVLIQRDAVDEEGEEDEQVIEVDGLLLPVDALDTLVEFALNSAANAGPNVLTAAHRIRKELNPELYP